MLCLACCLFTALCLRLTQQIIIFRNLHHRYSQFVSRKFVWKHLLGNSEKNRSGLILAQLVLKMNLKFLFFYYFKRSWILLEFEWELTDYLHRSKIKEEEYFLVEPLHYLNIQHAQIYTLPLTFYFELLNLIQVYFD